MNQFNISRLYVCKVDCKPYLQTWRPTRRRDVFSENAPRKVIFQLTVNKSIVFFHVCKPLYRVLQSTIDFYHAH